MVRQTTMGEQVDNKKEQTQQPEQEAVRNQRPADQKPEIRCRERIRHKTEFYGHNIMVTQIERRSEGAAKSFEAAKKSKL